MIISNIVVENVKKLNEMYVRIYSVCHTRNIKKYNIAYIDIENTVHFLQCIIHGNVWYSL
jgi:hypothetical protein